MDEAAPQAAGAGRGARTVTFRRELFMLRQGWGSAYEIESGGERGTARARRRDGLGDWMQGTPAENPPADRGGLPCPPGPPGSGPVSGSGPSPCVAWVTGHTATPKGGSYVREADGEPASLTNAADYPVIAECKVCRGRIRLRMLIQMEWEHASAQVPT